MLKMHLHRPRNHAKAASSTPHAQSIHASHLWGIHFLPLEQRSLLRCAYKERKRGTTE